jgi:hypothetical protein
MKLKTILESINESSASDFMAQVRSADKEVSSELKTQKKIPYKEVSNMLGDSYKTFDTMLNILQDKASKYKQKTRGTGDIEDIAPQSTKNTPIHQRMQDAGLLTPRGGLTEHALHYVKWLAMFNQSVPTKDNSPNRFRDSTVGAEADREQRGNFPQAVVSELRAMDTRRYRESGKAIRYGHSRNKLIAKIQNMAQMLSGRIEDKSRQR